MQNEWTKLAAECRNEAAEYARQQDEAKSRGDHRQARRLDIARRYALSDAKQHEWRAATGQ